MPNSNHLSFRDAPKGAGPESITTIVSMDSGLDAGASPRNDGGERCMHAMEVEEIAGPCAHCSRLRSTNDDSHDVLVKSVILRVMLLTQSLA